jgi:zinc transport system substrate-binding protein
MKKFEIFLCGMTLFSLLGVFLLPLALAGDRLQVTVSILPQKYFVEKIGGDRVDVSVMVLPGANPATYEPKPQQMVNLTKSKIYFAVGVHFETVWLRKFETFNPKMTIVSTQTGIEKIPMKTHLHDNDKGEADHKRAIHAEIKDPHIWLAPPLVMLQARNILDGLLKVDPGHREIYETNYKRFVRELVDLDIRLIHQFKGRAQNKRFMVYHPAWGYFARAYGLQQIPIEMEGKSPTPRELQELIGMARKDGIKVIFVQPQFSTRSADTIARAIGGKVMAADPLAVNWAESLEKVAASFETVLK